MRFSNTRTRVGNVANVQKMRKFEPMRLQTLDKMHKFENRSQSPNPDRNNVDLNESYLSNESQAAADRHADSLLRVRNGSSMERSVMSSPD